MPTYEYGCKSCGYRFEELQSMNEDPITLCPECGEESVERFVSGGAGLIFKGSGFYITDYARKNGSNGNGSESRSKTDNGSQSASPENKKSEKSKSSDSNNTERS